MKTSSLLLKLSKQFPKRLSVRFHDYIGKQIGELPNEVNRVLLCLDFDEEVLPTALEFKPDLILTHHPFIYGPYKEVLDNDPKKAELVELLNKNNLCIYTFHTNFDEGEGGMNDSLAKALDLVDIYAPNDEKLMRIGYLKEEMNVKDFSKYAIKKLNVNYGLLINEGPSIVKKVGIVGGGGSGDYKVAMKENCDIYVSGDASHYRRREMTRYKLNYLDVPHEIEKIFIPTMSEIIKKIDPSIEVKCVDHEREPMVIK